MAFATLVEQRSSNCDHCNEARQLSRTHCPHCGQPSFFPNVALAQAQSEACELQARYEEAIRQAQSRGCFEKIGEFAAACAASKPVMNCTLDKLFRAVASGTDIFPTYLDLERLKIRADTPAGLPWSRLRPQAEVELLNTDEHRGKLHYGLLSLTGAGLTTYGDYTIVLKENMISHRTSCFESNTGVYWHLNRAFPAGKRSDWPNRHMLCVAKMAGKLNSVTEPTEFQQILLNQGDSALNDEFIEIQIFGEITCKTIASVTVTSEVAFRDGHFWRTINEQLNNSGVEVQVI